MTNDAPRRTNGNYRARSYGACPTDGNCSSFGDGRSCGAPDCDGW